MMKTTSPSTFLELPAVKVLQSLAKDPLNLTQENVLNPERVKDYCLEACGFKLLYATERVTNDTVEALFTLAHEQHVLEKMEKMQSGEVINFIEGFPSENRAALHTALRDLFDHAQTAKPAMEASRLASLEVEKLKNFLPTLEAFPNLVLIGIGGSLLGPEALYLALEAYKIPGKVVKFVGNVDPDDMYEVLSTLDLSKTLVLVVSKSGTTLETSVNEAFAREFFQNHGLDPSNHFLAVTGEGSPMDNPKRYLASFYIWDWIGGRYSASSIIGGVILSFAFGFDLYLEFLKGAHAIDQNALEKDPRKNLPLFSALLGVWNHNFLKIETNAIIPYARALSRFPAHLQQLDMESNGKQIDRTGHFVDYSTGPIIWGEPGTNAQHSFFQLIHQGKSQVSIEFIGFKESQAGHDFIYQGTTSQQKLLSNLFAQSIALATGQQSTNPNQVFLGNRPSSILLAEKLTPFALGALLAYFEHKVAFQGFLWNINSFDQEGVQLGKVLGQKIIDCFKPSDEKSYPLAESYLKHLEF